MEETRLSLLRKEALLSADESAAGWPVVEDFSKLDEGFQEKLAKAGVLLVPEMERWERTGMQLADRFGTLAEGLLRRGGNVVILCPRQNQLPFLKAARIIALAAGGSRDGATVTFTKDGRRIAHGVGPSFRTTNSTQFYKVPGDKKVKALAQSSHGVPVVVRRVGSGWVIVLGMDYYKHSPQTARLLINAITYR